MYCTYTALTYFKISAELSVEQILAVEILQHRFNLEKMVKIAEILLTYSDEGEAGSLQVF